MTNLVIVAGTLPEFSAHCIVTGIVAALLAHANAVVWAGKMNRKYPKGLEPVMYRKKLVYTTKTWTNSPDTTAIQRYPTLEKDSPKSS